VSISCPGQFLHAAARLLDRAAGGAPDASPRDAVPLELVQAEAAAGHPEALERFPDLLTPDAGSCGRPCTFWIE
jgi:hypothetical protein